MNKIIIGVTDCSKFDTYSNWILMDGEVEVIKLSYKDNNFDVIKRCQGILLTGGEDVHPRFYNKPEYLPMCHTDDVDERRDEFEWKVLDYSQVNSIPVLGVCRGLQMANVYFGGTLIPDIPTFGKFNHSKLGNVDRYHSIHVDPNSLLWSITDSKNGEINSNHHQSADRIGKGLVANCFSEDGVIEGLERKNREGHPFLLLVQWHPERMKDQSQVFTQNIRRKFIEATKNLI